MGICIFYLCKSPLQMFVATQNLFLFLDYCVINRMKSN